MSTRARAPGRHWEKKEEGVRGCCHVTHEIAMMVGLPLSAGDRSDANEHNITRHWPPEGASYNQWILHSVKSGIIYNLKLKTISKGKETYVYS